MKREVNLSAWTRRTERLRRPWWLSFFWEQYTTTLLWIQQDLLTAESRTSVYKQNHNFIVKNTAAEQWVLFKVNLNSYLFIKHPRWPTWRVSIKSSRLNSLNSPMAQAQVATRTAKARNQSEWRMQSLSTVACSCSEIKPTWSQKCLSLVQQEHPISQERMSQNSSEWWTSCFTSSSLKLLRKNSSV